MATNEPTSGPNALTRVGFYSLAVNLGLAGVKLALSFITGSLALRADGIHSSVDVFGSAALILGLVVSGRKSEKFPYGLYKVENVVAVVISLLLFVTAYEIVTEAVRGDTQTLPLQGWMLGVVAALILVPFLFGRYEVKAGERFNSPSLTADGRQFKADVLSSSIVFFALIGQRFGLPLDRIAAGIVAVFIVRAGWDLLVGSMRVLLDASVDYGTRERVRSLIEEEPLVGEVRHITGRNSGRYVFIEATVTMRTPDLDRAHRASQQLEKKIKAQECCVDRVLIHYEPEKKQWVRYAIPVADDKGTVSDHFGESHYFALVDMDLRTGEVQRQQWLSNAHAGAGKGKGIKVARFLLEHKPDVVISRESLSGHGPGYALGDVGVSLRQTAATYLSDLVQQLKEEARQQVGAS
ncbi:MAG: cation diffusion facilitator family transporter [Chloroflexota bacterium]